MKEKLDLSSIMGYQYNIANDEMRDRTVGYYKDYNTAVVEAKNNTSGWFGSPAKEVESVILYTDGECLYQVKEVGKFIDEERLYKENLTKSIKSKLSPEELKLLGL